MFSISSNKLTSATLLLVIGLFISFYPLQAQTEAQTQESPAPAEVVAPAIKLVEGKDYVTKFPNEQSKKPMIVEFFSYMCQHCYNFETTVKLWEKQKPESVELLRIPVSFGRDQWRLAAKSYYIAEELKLVDQFSKVIFKKIHIERKPPRKLKDIEQLFATIGVDNKAFKNAANSFNVDSKIRKADFLTKKFKVSGVPYFLINFKYEVGKENYSSQEGLFKVWNNLPAIDF